MKQGWIIWIILVIAAFFLGYFIKSESSDIEDFQSQIADLKQQNSELESQINTLTLEKADLNSQIQNLQNQLDVCEMDCQEIINDSDNYYKSFLNANCLNNDDCIKISPLNSCGACVSSSINITKVDGFNEQFQSKECLNTGGCPAVVMYCECVNATCKMHY